MAGWLVQCVAEGSLGFMEIFHSKLELMGLSGGEESDTFSCFLREKAHIYRKS